MLVVIKQIHIRAAQRSLLRWIILSNFEEYMMCVLYYDDVFIACFAVA